MSDNLLLTTSVGSFGKPEYLTKARGQVARGKLGPTELEELERKATAEWIRRQEDIGLDVFRTQYVLLGVVDARNTRLETADEVARYAERALKLVPPERLVLATTTSLEYLPRDVARGKLTALVEGARLVTGEKAGAGAPVGGGAPA